LYPPYSLVHSWSASSRLCSAAGERNLRKTYTVLAGPGKQVVLAVYEDKTFTADLDGRRIRAVRMRQTADLKDVQVTVEDLGQLRSTRGFLEPFFSWGF
jgi:hypothetical protein